MANHYGITVAGLNETQLHQSRSQVASCMSKRLHGKSVTMLLMTSRSELRPCF